MAVLLDNDRNPADATVLGEIEKAGVRVFRWSTGLATEDHLFRDLPVPSVHALIDSAAEDRGEQSLLDRVDPELSSRSFRTFAELKQAAADTDVRIALGEAAKARDKNDQAERGWFKDISLAEWVGQIHVGPSLHMMTGNFPATLEQIRTWIHRGP